MLEDLPIPYSETKTRPHLTSEGFWEKKKLDVKKTEAIKKAYMIEYPPKQYVTQNLMEREVRKGLTKCVEDVYKKRKLHSLTFLLFRFNFFDNTCLIRYAVITCIQFIPYIILSFFKYILGFNFFHDTQFNLLFTVAVMVGFFR